MCIRDRLELVRLKHLLAMQSEVFGDIDIVVAPVEMERIVPEEYNTDIVESL